MNASAVTETIDRFEQLGIAVFPGIYGKKGTYIKGWPSMSVPDAIATTRAEARAHAGRINLAARTGPAVDGTCYLVVDIDDADNAVEARRRTLEVLGEHVACIVRTSRGQHFWIRVADPMLTGAGPFGDVLCVNAKGLGHLANLPPSLHPSGRHYEWEAVQHG